MPDYGGDIMIIVNLTQHDVNLYLENDTKVITFQGVGAERAARVSVESTPAPSIRTLDGDLPFVKRVFGEVTGLPEPREDTLFIVSSLVMGQVPERKDCIAPDTGPDSVKRDDDGRIIGVRRFTQDA